MIFKPFLPFGFRREKRLAHAVAASHTYPFLSMQKLALLSVSDKRGLVEFATALVKTHGYTLLSTGGTAKLLAEKGLPVTEGSASTPASPR